MEICAINKLSCLKKRFNIYLVKPTDSANFSHTFFDESKCVFPTYKCILSANVWIILQKWYFWLPIITGLVVK